MGNRLLVFSLFFLLTTTSAFAESPNNDELRQQIASQWALMREGIVTADIEFDSAFLYFPPKPVPPPNDQSPAPAFPKPMLSPDEVLALIEECGLLSTPEERQRLVDGTHVGQKPIADPWQLSRRLWVKGSQLRDESRSTIYLLDESNYFDVSREGNTRISLFLRGKYNVDHTSLYDFHHIPFNTEEVLKSYDITSNPELGTHTLRLPGDTSPNSPTQLTIDAASGLPLTWRQGTTREIARDIVHKDLIQLPNGLSIPRVSYDVDYYENKTLIIRVLIIKQVQFNTPVADSVFRLQAAKGDVLLDHRGTELQSARLTYDVNDVLAFMDGRSPLPSTMAIPAADTINGLTKPQEASRRHFPAWLILLFVNGVVVLIVGALMWRRSRASQS
ncbi:MAG: hypothetical protein KDA69_02180 [Planctomycetaceae bacterium]|nr:hypothetical protein [Planctomycetaceae bacterium]